MTKPDRKMNVVLVTFRKGRKYCAAWIDSEIGIDYYTTAPTRTRLDAAADARAWYAGDGKALRDVTAAFLKAQFGVVGNVWHREEAPGFTLDGDGQRVEYFITRDLNDTEVVIYGRSHRSRVVPRKQLDACLTDRARERALVGWRLRSSAERHALRYYGAVDIVELTVGA